jgi:hypothetical protein
MYHNYKLHEALLRRSAFSGTITIVQQLILDNKIKDINAIDVWNKRTALHFAAENNHDDVIRFLLAHGANPMLEDINGHTPLNLYRYKNPSVAISIVLTTIVQAEPKNAEDVLIVNMSKAFIEHFQEKPYAVITSDGDFIIVDTIKALAKLQSEISVNNYKPNKTAIPDNIFLTS